MKKRYKLLEYHAPILTTLLVLFLIALPGISQVQVMVTEGGIAFTACADHASWATATYDLQTAIDSAEARGGGVIWVAGGTYQPTSFHNPYLDTDETVPPVDNRNLSFLPKNGVTVIGGFSGTENSREDRPSNLFEGANATILSGDLGEPGDNTDNSYHVVFCPIGITNSAILKDLIIAHGNANGYDHMTGTSPDTIPYSKRGGGIQARGGGYFENCMVTDNYAETLGGGAYLYKGGVMSECRVFNNRADENGGGVNAYLGGTVRRSVVYNNYADKKGGGVFVESDSQSGEISSLLHSIILANSSGSKGGGVGIYDGGFVTNNLIANNTTSGNGGGVHLQTGGLVLSNTIVANYAEGGAGLYADNGGQITNTVIWGNSTPYSYSKEQFHRTHETTLLDYCAIENIEPDNGITNLITLNSENSGEGLHPEFLNPSTVIGLPDESQLEEVMNADYSIGLKSALLDTGTPDLTGLPITTNDLNGAPRVTKSSIDMGAYETLYHTVTSTVTAETGGTLLPAGLTNLLPGASHEFTLTPDANYRVASFSLNGVDVQDQLIAQDAYFTYTVSDISEDIEALAEFTLTTGLNSSETTVTRFYPNPASSFIQIEGQDLQSAEIFSLSGKLMKEINSEALNHSIVIGDLPKGVYFVIITLKTKERIIEKLIKQ